MKHVILGCEPRTFPMWVQLHDCRATACHLLPQFLLEHSSIRPSSLPCMINLSITGFTYRSHGYLHKLSIYMKGIQNFTKNDNKYEFTFIPYFLFYFR